MTISDNMQTYFDKLRDKFQFQVDILDQIYLIQETRQLDFSKGRCRFCNCCRN